MSKMLRSISRKRCRLLRLSKSEMSVFLLFIYPGGEISPILIEVDSYLPYGDGGRMHHRIMVLSDFSVD